MKELPLVSRARAHGPATAFQTPDESHSYEELLGRSATVAGALLGSETDLNEARIAFLIPTGPVYTSVQWGIWRGGGVTVPLCLSAPEPEWEYALTDSDVSTVVVSTGTAAKIEALCSRLQIRLLVSDEISDEAEPALPEVTIERRAMILYTSGTTGKPKGVVTTHANIQAQIESLVEAWEWQSDDRIPLFLPLHHIHGIINVMSCALWMGATIEPFSNFDLPSILARVKVDAYTVFMAVPTIYVKLISALEEADQAEREAVTSAFARMRLMISGSAALPASIHEKWTELTGQKLLERYGMTEIGMALSNPFHGERRPGAVGKPLPDVDVRLKTESGERVTAEDEPGEIQVRGPAVFLEYWKREKITEESFDDGWFRTGDMAVLETGYYRILGRLSVDIIKSGGYKLSALEIEAVLLEHPAIRECAVIGAPDDTWGEAVAAAVVLNDGRELDLVSLREWCREQMSAYKIPKILKLIESLPRNAMGKVTKPAVRELFSVANG